MNDYILKYESDNEWLSHHGILGQRKGVIKSYVGKYYIPKGRKGLDRAKGQLEKDIKTRGKDYNDTVAKLWSDRQSGEISEKRHRKLVEKETKRYKKDQEEFKKRLEKIEDGYKDVDRNDINALKKKKMAELTDDELDRLQERTRKEQMTSNFIKNTNKNEEGPTASTRDLIRSAEGINRTLSGINREVQKNPPLKKQKKVDISEMSDQDIIRAINRAQLEQRYNDVVNAPQINTGRLKAAAALSAIGTAAVVGTQVADFIITAKQVKS